MKQQDDQVERAKVQFPSKLDKRQMLGSDEDFLALSTSGIKHRGIVYCHRNAQDIGRVIEFLVLIDACTAEDDMVDHVEFC